MVSAGIVLTVSGPMSSSTYITSLYAGFFVEVDAHRQRCGRAPAAASVSQRSPENVSRYCSIRELGVGDRELPLKILAADLVETTVGLRIHARDEEARDRDDLRGIAAFGDQALETLDVRLRDLGVPLEREDERDVDRPSGGDAVLDRAEPRLRSGDLHVGVRPIDELVQPHGLRVGRVTVVRQLGVDLDRDVAVDAAVSAPRPVAGARRPHVRPRRRVRERPPWCLPRDRAAPAAARRTTRPWRAPSRRWSGSRLRRRPRPPRISRASSPVSSISRDSESIQTLTP